MLLQRNLLHTHSPPKENNGYGEDFTKKKISTNGKPIRSCFIPFFEEWPCNEEGVTTFIIDFSKEEDA